MLFSLSEGKQTQGGGTGYLILDVLVGLFLVLTLVYGLIFGNLGVVLLAGLAIITLLTLRSIIYSKDFSIPFMSSLFSKFSVIPSFVALLVILSWFIYLSIGLPSFPFWTYVSIVSILILAVNAVVFLITFYPYLKKRE
ncbi:MAG: hypothetical protein J7L47_01430 [Candidatus Odinarchaeota archaeon]|nr:hypothetical protein [Candidatus Odinarchaeota archaeon]